MAKTKKKKSNLAKQNKSKNVTATKKKTSDGAKSSKNTGTTKNTKQIKGVKVEKVKTKTATEEITEDKIKDKKTAHTKTKESTKGKAESTNGKTEPVKGKAESAQVKTEPVMEKAESVKGKAEPAKVKTEPVKEKTESTMGKTEPVKGKADSAKGKAEPAKVNTESVKGKADSAKVKTEPVKEKTESTKGKAESAKGKVEPVIDNREPSPVAENRPQQQRTVPDNGEPFPVAEKISYIKGYTAKQLIACACLILAFTFTYNSLVVPYRNKNFVDQNSSTIAVTTTGPSTEITTEVTTENVETTTRIPATAPTKAFKKKAAAAVVQVAAPKRVLITVPYASQNPNYPTGCEAGSATMVLNYWGYNISVDTMISAIPRENLYKEQLSDGSWRVYGPSIYEKFVGDPRMTYTSATPGYGAFAPVVTAAMNRVMSARGGKHVAYNITGSSIQTLFKHLDEGHPLVVWSTSGMKTPKYVNCWYIKTSSGDKYFEYPRGTHVTVLVGYDSNRVYFQDPWSPGLRAYAISAFSSKYNLLGTQAIVVLPKVETTTAATTTTAVTTTETDVTTTTTTEETSTETTSEENTTVDETTTVDTSEGEGETPGESVTPPDEGSENSGE
ncbi:MAG: C39 family peptidase [Oscillospiraceae bacterium]|nr:C39 family peptidase [Oscillospiraceae bacterium]